MNPYAFLCLVFAIVVGLSIYAGLSIALGKYLRHVRRTETRRP